MLSSSKLARMQIAACGMQALSAACLLQETAVAHMHCGHQACTISLVRAPDWQAATLNQYSDHTCRMSRWYRDPTVPVSRSEYTRFPHAVLEVKLSLAEGQRAPEWVTELINSGMLTEASSPLPWLLGLRCPRAPVTLYSWQ